MTPSAILSAKTRSETRFINPGPRPHTGFADTVRALPSNMRTGRSHILHPPLFPHSHPHPPVVGSHADCPRLRYDRLAFRKRLRPKRSDRFRVQNSFQRTPGDERPRHPRHSCKPPLGNRSGRPQKQQETFRTEHSAAFHCLTTSERTSQPVSSTDPSSHEDPQRPPPTRGAAPATHHWETGADACKSNKTLFGPSIPRRPLLHNIRANVQPMSNIEPSFHEDPQRPPPTLGDAPANHHWKTERMPAKATKLFSDRAFCGAPRLHNIRANVPTGVEYRSVIPRGSGNKRLRHPRCPCEPPLGNRKECQHKQQETFRTSPSAPTVLPHYGLRA